MTGEVMSFIVFTAYTKKIGIGCASCLDKANNNSLLKSVLLGWWGIPWGIINTIRSIILNLRSKKSNHSYEHSDYLVGFALSKIGELETYKGNKQKLQEIITDQNNK